MKSKMRNNLLAALLISVSGAAFAWYPPSGKGNEGDNGSVMSTKAANCPASQERLWMEFNDVRTLIETGGSLWQDRSLGRAAYYVPKPGGSGVGPSVIFSGALWMGGTDVNGQLKLAANLFRSGGRTDFWTGPLTVTPYSGTFSPLAPVIGDVIRDFGEATIAPETCIAYDRFFTIRKAEVMNFIQWWTCANDPEATGCDNVEMDNDALNRIINWPAHGDVGRGQDFYLAPFYDRNKDGVYNPIVDGDYPWYDLEDEVDCRADRRITLFGDETHWWVFNDKGNIHTESGGDPIGMEIRAQAFTFATNDEVNKMTFYNYEMINRGTQTLFNTYFGHFVDPDVGGYNDDYIGCDVERGMGYAFNGKTFDQTVATAIGYGANPPAVGVDFFEGPYQDDDGKDNVGPRRDTLSDGSIVWNVPSAAEARLDGGIVYPGLGIGYGDGVIDNERYGMKRFVMFNNASWGGVPGISDDPSTAVHFYRYMTGFWKNNQRFTYGGMGYPGSNGNNPTVITDYIFPGDSDPLGWGTPGSAPQAPWSEITNENPEGDRRFCQAAGPFTLRPGAVNNITVGVVYARSTESDLLASVRELKRADTKAQALFDNCFQILEPPTAPLLTIQELENELILMISNPSGNNVGEEYKEEDRINIVDPVDGTTYDKFYRFEGYQIFQMKNAESSVADLEDSDQARLVAQCDIKNGVKRLINYEFDEAMGVAIPRMKVDGKDEGIRHTFQITEDQFASGDRRLVNHKTYYYIAVAYAYNQFKEYDPTDPMKLDGQQMPYISSRLQYNGAAISSVAAIPHHPMPGAGGTYQMVGYGATPEVTRLAGDGNQGLSVDLTASTINAILANGSVKAPIYREGAAPIGIKVVDPLNVVPGHFELQFNKFVSGGAPPSIDTASWTIYRYTSKGGTLIDSVKSERTIRVMNEQIIPEWGISVAIEQVNYFLNPGTSPLPVNFVTNPIEATMVFADSSKAWLIGVPDSDNFGPDNWILSGKINDESEPCYRDNSARDPDEKYENLLGGIITHFSLLRSCGPAAPIVGHAQFNVTTAQTQARMADAPGVDIVFTADKSKWTRATVVELCQEAALAQNNGQVSRPRNRASVDKNGRSVGQAGYNAEEGGLGSATGMGWFPGYAIDVETGRRLNIAFGENSFLAGENGADMMWNPTSRFYDNVGNAVFGGQHVIYIIGENINNSNMPIYQGDFGQKFREDIASTNANAVRDAWKSVTWVMYPMVIPGRTLLGSDVRIRMRVSKEFGNRVLDPEMGAAPRFEWNMNKLATMINQQDALVEALEMINVVPNPYYAFSQYERDRIDTRIKITNLPDKCSVKIFNVQGKLVRQFEKDNAITSLDWDLKNFRGIPIASGVYIIHVNVPGMGERILKWFGGMRQPDFENL